MRIKQTLKIVLQTLLGKLYPYFFAVYRLLVFRLDFKEKSYKLFMRKIKIDANILDIGANIGIMTYFFSRKIKNGKVFSFEPIPQNFKVLSAITRLFRLRNVEIHQIALGNENKEVNMILPEEDGIKLYALSHVKDPELIYFNKGNEYSVPMKRLDDIEKLKNIRIDIIKMDVENYEFEVLKGAKDIILKNKPVITCELWKNENRENTFGLLTSMGYKTKVVINNEFVDFDSGKHETNDFFFFPN